MMERAKYQNHGGRAMTVEISPRQLILAQLIREHDENNVTK